MGVGTDVKILLQEVNIMFYIDIDITKFRHFAFIVSSDGKVIVWSFPFENSHQDFIKLIEEIENFQNFLIVLESSGVIIKKILFSFYTNVITLLQ